MSNIPAAREEITKAAGLLVNRFGHEADVFARLNAALEHLRDDPPVRSRKEPETVSTDAAVVEETEAALSTPPPSPTPTSAKPRRGGFGR
ncbi:MAG TPA: hypothetical protein VJP78_08040 [Thermoleophilia bacterium]|nr:hypothetical protein [Thermoleophilia bacterium]